ncbi:MAG: metallophosphoesterase [Hyphomicrobiales bacterium]|nr:metallophosphoesterase [Hyphomicrobiales bacterium]
MLLLAHLSDPHLGPLPEPRLHELASKRLFGYLNWLGSRGAVLVNDTLTRLTDDIAAQGPDHIAVTGDLVNLSLNAELPMARAWLGELGRPRDVSVVPGNHDAYVPGAIKRVNADWRDYMRGDFAAPADDADTVADDFLAASFPYVRIRPPVAVVGVSTARATAPLMATGYFDATQALRLQDTLVHLGHEGLFRIVLIHHPPVRERNDWYRRLIGASRFRAAIAAAGAEIVLHGHNHHAGIRFIDGPRADVPVVGVPSASQRPDGKGRGARYNLFAISGEVGKWRCTMTERGLVHPGQEVTAIAHHTLYGPPGAEFALPA